MTTMPRLGATELVEGQAVPETTVNENLRYVEQGAGFFIVKDKDLATPPGSPVDGDAYIVAATATGVWTGHETHLAFYMSTEWKFITPIEGSRAAVQDENVDYRFDGSAWATTSTTPTQYYRLGFFFTTTPTSSEVLCLHVVTDAFTIPANFATPDSKGSVGTNPTSSFAIDVQNNGVTIGTITIGTGGSITWATASGTAKSIAAGDVLKFVAPASADATIANVAITVKGSMI